MLIAVAELPLLALYHHMAEQQNDSIQEFNDEGTNKMYTE